MSTTNETPALTGADSSPALAAHTAHAAHAAHAAPSVPPLTRAAWALLCSAYLSQFVASSFFYMAMIAILRGRGVALEQLGWIYLLGLVPAVKFLWAPLLDRHGFGAWGHYSRWLVLMQGLLILTFLWLGTLPMSQEDPLPLGALVTGCLLISLLTSLQDIAADGLSCRLLGPAQRGLGNALQMACGMLGFAAGGGGVLIMVEHWGWQTAIYSLTALNALTLLQALFYREPPHAGPLVHEQLSVGAQWKRLMQFWKQPGTGWRWLLVVTTANAGFCMAYGLMTPMLVDAGWSMGDIGQYLNIYGVLMGTASMAGIGLAMRRWSPARTMRWVMAAQILAVVAVILMHVSLEQKLPTFAVVLCIAAYMAFYAPVDVLLPTLMMERASPSTPATDFSMQNGLYFSAGILISSAAGIQLAAATSYGATLGVALAVSIVLSLAIPALWRRANARAAAASKAQ